ncbi:MAG TPA: hypothetical protein VK668_01175 [Mucilaginibacter sp.]|nr:hypothetical protein [Mucilaginibacter sp.]
MKKLLYVLFVAAAMFTGCQKDTATNVSIGSSDLSSVNNQLKGTWVFPVQTMSIVDDAGKPLAPDQSLSAPVFKFDGNSKVDIRPDLHTLIKGTYLLSTKNGLIYVEVIYPDGTGVKYQVMSLNSETLKLNSKQSTTYYNGNTPIAADAIYSTLFKKQNSADVTGNLVRVVVTSDSLYNVGVYVKHNVAAPADTAVLMNSQVKVTGGYNYAFPAHPGDHVTVDIFGSLTKTAFYVYYNGIPLSGQVDSGYGEIRSGNGWDIP